MRIAFLVIYSIDEAMLAVMTFKIDAVLLRSKFERRHERRIHIR